MNCYNGVLENGVVQKLLAVYVFDCLTDAHVSSSLPQTVNVAMEARPPDPPVHVLPGFLFPIPTSEGP